MKWLRIETVVWGLIALVLLVGPAAVLAQAPDYPTKPIEIIVPFVPGGGTDLTARLVADYLGKKWGQPILVVNKPGGGMIGARAALKESKPDGYTVLIDIHTTSSMHIGASKTPLLTLADRKYAGRVVRDPNILPVDVRAQLNRAEPQLVHDAAQFPNGFPRVLHRKDRRADKPALGSATSKNARISYRCPMARTFK
jgi:tripartite-type tricarboxylate transporter receptor subunit TctC